MNSTGPSSFKEIILGDDEKIQNLDILYFRRKLKSQLLALFTILIILSLVASMWLWFISANTKWMWAFCLWVIFFIFSIAGLSDVDDKKGTSHNA